MFNVSSLFGLGLQLLHLLPAAVGLFIVLPMRTTGRWRTWALLSFGLALLSGIASFVLTLSLYAGGYRMVGSGVYGIGQALLGLVSLTAAGFGVAAVVADRRERPADPGA